MSENKRKRDEYHVKQSNQIMKLTMNITQYLHRRI